jgi:hypothetical protein
MFGRRRGRTPSATPEAYPFSGVGAAYGLAQPPGLSAAASAHVGGTAGWRALPGFVPTAYQTGAYAGQLLNQYPARIDGPQLHSGREWGRTGWDYPTATPLPGNGQLGQTQRPNNIAGAQRYGSLFSGPIGPITAQRNAALVAIAQVKTSGLQAVQWAKALNPVTAAQQQGG